MEFFKIVWRLLKPFRSQIFLYAALIVVYELAQLADSYVISLVIGFVERGLDLRMSAAALVGILIFDELFRILDRRVDWQIIVRLWNPIYRYLKSTSIRRFLEMEMRWHYQQRSGALIGKVQDGTDKVVDMVMRMGWEFVPTIVQTIVTLIPLLFLNPYIVLVLLGSFIVFLLLSVRQHRAQEPLWKVRHDAFEEEWGESQEMVSNVEAVALYNQQERLLGNHGSILKRIGDTSDDEAQIWIYKYGRWRHGIQGLARRAVLVLLALQVAQGSLTIASMIFIWTLTERLFHAFWRFARLHNDASRSVEAARRLKSVLDLQPSLVSAANPRTIPGGPVTLTFEDVTFSYDGNGESIRDLNLVIRGGETVGVVGPSGAGKTTLRRLLMRSWDVSEGKVLVNGVDIRDLDLEDLRQLFAYVPQGDETAIFNETFAFNIAFGRPGASIKEVEAAANFAGIHDFIAGCKDGYETLLGERGLRLSGGQKQRVALARAILADRPVLILDEATSSVDSITEDEIQARLVPILKDQHRTVLIIAHRLSTVWGVADRILVFNGGRLVEEGTHDALIAEEGLYADLFRRQSQAVSGDPFG